MKRKGKLRTFAVAATLAVAVVVATAAVVLTRPMGGDRRTTDGHIVGDKLLEMLFCIPGMDCGATKSTPSFGTAASAAPLLVFYREEAA